jgi:hypothetical protein
MKLTAGVNFINILRAPFWMKVFFGSFSLITAAQKIFKQKAALKMLMKLPPGQPLKLS